MPSRPSPPSDLEGPLRPSDLGPQPRPTDLGRPRRPSRIHRILHLSPLERGLLLRAAAWVALVRAGLACLPFPRLRALCDRLAAHAAIAGATPEQARWAVLAVANRVPGTRCLARALALQSLLRQAGFASDLRLGVAKDESRGFAAHAWVDLDGRSLLAGDDLGYTPLASFPG